MTVVRVAVTGQSLQGEPVALERAGLALTVMSPAACDALAEDGLVRRRSDELAAGQVLMQMRAAAMAGDWSAVDKLLADAQARFVGNPWLVGILEAMVEVAASRSRERMTKEAMYSSSRLNMRLAEKNEARFCTSDEAAPAYLRRKKLQGKREV